MSAIRQVQNFWILSVTTIVLACFSNAVAQARYKVQDQGVQHPDNLGMAMGLNNHGWTLIMDQLLDHSVTSTQFPALSGTDRISIDQLELPLGTLGGKNSSINWNGINDPGEAVGMSETSAQDPNGEDVCLFGTHAICLPFLWQNGVMRALPTVGGINGQASAINNNGQVVGYAENGLVDSTCQAGTTNNRVDLPVLWVKDKGKYKANALPTIGLDTDGVAFGINNEDQAVGYSGTCSAANHAVLWEFDAGLLRFPTLELRVASPTPLTTTTRLLGKPSTPRAQPWPLSGRTTQSKPLAAFCREMVPLLPPASTTGARWWEVPSTPPAGPTA